MRLDLLRCYFERPSASFSISNISSRRDDVNGGAETKTPSFHTSAEYVRFLTLWNYRTILFVDCCTPRWSICTCRARVNDETLGIFISHSSEIMPPLTSICSGAWRARIALPMIRHDDYYALELVPLLHSEWMIPIEWMCKTSAADV